MSYPIPNPEKRREEIFSNVFLSHFGCRDAPQLRELFDHLGACPLDVEKLAFCALWSCHLLYSCNPPGGFTELEIAYVLQFGLLQQGRPAEDGTCEESNRRILELAMAAVKRALALKWLVPFRSIDGCLTLSLLGQGALRDYHESIFGARADRAHAGSVSLREFIAAKGFRGAEVRKAHERFEKYIRRHRLLPKPLERGRCTEAGKPARPSFYSPSALENLWHEYASAGHMAGPKRRQKDS
jgi:hypothetical protein